MADEKKVVLSTEDLVKAIASNGEVGLNQKDVRAVVKELEEVVVQALTEGSKVQMTGFITIEPTYRGERKANNIVTGEPMEIPETVAVKVKAGSKLKSAVADLDPADFDKKKDDKPEGKAKKDNGKSKAKKKKK